jgi:hypothetical protein
MNTTEVLDQIGNAVNDWEVGPDAMRFNAPAEEVTHPTPVHPRAPEPPARNSIDLAELRRAMEALHRTLTATKVPSAAAVAVEEAPQAAPLCIDGHAYRRRSRRRRGR